jgi:predicted nucleic acid-binding protein
MDVILDTNALSAFFDGDPEVEELLSRASGLYLPVIVLGEYRFGLKGSRVGKKREKTLNAFSEICVVLPILDFTTVYYATIRDELKSSGTPIPENDIWIAALSFEHSLPVVSRERHFDKIRRFNRISW